MIRLALHTLGCRTNQAELASIRTGIETAGEEIAFVRWDEPADVYLLHTCSVTARADRQCRQKLHQAARTAPQASLVVSGCYAQLSPDTLAALPNVHAVVGLAHRAELPRLVLALARGDAGEGSVQVRPPGVDDGLDDLPVGRDDRRTRAPLKIQEGCDRSCAYCVVPLARGPERSLAAEEVLNRARALARAGHPEIVLTGTHTGRWGRGLGAGERLPQLLDRLLDTCADVRFRVSSLDPQEVSDALLQRVAGEPRLCSHLHLSLQHTRPGILAAMRRPLDGPDVVARVCATLPDACVGVDVIAGFPGETASDAAAMLDWLAAAGLAYLHPFRYSARAGTPAASMAGQVPTDVARSRVAALRELGEQSLRPRFGRSLVGRDLEVVVERADGVRRTGVSSEFATVRFTAPDLHVGAVARVRVTDVDGSSCLGMLR